MENQGETLSSCAKVCRGKEVLKDLPDELILYVLCFLNLKEAGRTSVLSRRWRYLWAHIPILSFGYDLTESHKNSWYGWCDPQEETLSLMDQVMGLHKGPTIDEFRVHFRLRTTTGCNIDNWVNFAINKRVKRLKFDFSCCGAGGEKHLHTFHGLSICNLLTSLQLVDVDVNGDVLQSFFRSCPNLENLYVDRSNSLVNLELVAEETRSLKYFKVRLCPNIELIDIHAPNLISLDYFGPLIDLPLEEFPMLVKLSLGGHSGQYVTNKFLEFSGYLCQLEALTLDLSYLNEVMQSVDQFPKCTKLRRLELMGYLRNDETALFCLVKMIKACPLLHKFVLKGTVKHRWDMVRERLEVEACPHYHLKVIEIEYCNWKHFEFIMYLAERCVALKKIILAPRVHVSQKNVKELRAKLIPGADLVIKS